MDEFKAANGKNAGGRSTRLLTKSRSPILAVSGLSLALFGLGLAAKFAAPLRLGIHADFPLFLEFGWPRRKTLFLAIAVCTPGGIVLLLAKIAAEDRADRRRLAGNSVLSAVSSVFAFVMAEIVVWTLDNILLWPMENRMAKQQALARAETNNESSSDPWVGTNPNTSPK